MWKASTAYPVLGLLSSSSVISFHSHDQTSRDTNQSEPKEVSTIRFYIEQNKNPWLLHGSFQGSKSLSVQESFA